MVTPRNLRRAVVLLAAVSLLLAAPGVLQAECGCCAMDKEKVSDGQKPACQACLELGGMCKACVAKKGTTEMKEQQATIDTPALKVLLGAKVPLKVVDARGAEVDQKIPGALALRADVDDETIAKALPEKDGLIVTYCASLACPASHMLATRLAKLGYRNVIEYPKGIKGWVEDGGEVEKVER
jgi:rhodanese-related sulfurtransferase